MAKIAAWLKDWWLAIVGAVGGLLLWLRFVHDPKVRKRAKVQVKKKNLEERQRRMEESHAETRRKERKLREKAERLEEEGVEPAPSADAAADRLAERMGWSTGDAS